MLYNIIKDIIYVENNNDKRRNDKENEILKSENNKLKTILYISKEN